MSTVSRLRARDSDAAVLYAPPHAFAAIATARAPREMPTLRARMRLDKTQKKRQQPTPDWCCAFHARTAHDGARHRRRARAEAVATRRTPRQSITAEG